jgi:hypothetical protein
MKRYNSRVARKYSLLGHRGAPLFGQNPVLVFRVEPIQTSLENYSSILLRKETSLAVIALTETHRATHTLLYLAWAHRV